MNFYVFEQGFTYVDQEQQINVYPQKKRSLVFLFHCKSWVHVYPYFQIAITVI